MAATTAHRSACVLLAAMIARSFALPAVAGSPTTPNSRRSELPSTPSQPQLSTGVVAGAVTGVVAVLLVIGLGYFVIRRNRRRRNTSIGRTRSASPNGASVRLEPTVRKPLVLNLASPTRASFSFSPRRETHKAFSEPPVLSPISMTSPISPPSGVTPPSPVMKRSPETNLRRPRSLMSISSDFSLFYQPQQTIHALTTPMPSPPPTRLTHSQNPSHSTTQKNSISDASRDSAERRSRPSTATHGTTGHGLRSASTSTAVVPQQHHHPTQGSWSMAVEELILRCSAIEGSSPPTHSRASYAGKDNSPPSRSRVATAVSEP